MLDCPLKLGFVVFVPLMKVFWGGGGGGCLNTYNRHNKQKIFS